MKVRDLMRQATYLQQERGGGVDVGYVSTGHFAGGPVVFPDQNDAHC